MIVVTTSCAPVSAFRTPTIPPQTMPPAMPPSSTSGTRMIPGRLPSFTPMTFAAIKPMMNCPSAPMLKSPPRKAMATERPVRIKGVVATMVSEICNAG